MNIFIKVCINQYLLWNVPSFQTKMWLNTKKCNNESRNIFMWENWKTEEIREDNISVNNDL